MKLIKIIIALIIVLFSVSAFSQIVDLTTVPIYAIDDFNPEWVNSPPDFNSDWLYIPPSSNGFRSLKIKSMNFKTKGNPVKSLFIREKAHDYTFIFKFNLTGDVLNENRFLGLYLASIGPNYEIFINGQKIDSEIHISENGTITDRKYRKNYLAEIDHYSLKTSNILMIRIIGEPSSNDCGFRQSKPYVIDYYNILAVERYDVIAYILIVVYFLIGIYHLYLFISYTKQKYYLYYAILSFIVFVYFLARTNNLYLYFKNSETATAVELVSLFMIMPVLGFFINSLLYNKIKKFFRMYFWFSVFLAVLIIVGNIRAKQVVLKLWQYTFLIPLLNIFIFDLIKSFLDDFDNYKSKEQVENDKISKFHLIIKTFIYSVSGNILFGTVIVSITVIYDVINSLYIHASFFSSKYGFFIFMGSIAFIFSRRFYIMSVKYEILNTELIQNVKDLKKANNEITLSNQRYLHLVEETEDIIFSLDKNLIFRKINSMVYLHLKYDPQDLLGTSFKDILYHEVKHSEIVKEIVKENFDKLLLSDKSGTSVHFKTLLKSRYNTEPVEMRIYLVLLKFHDEIEIIGKASPSIDDALVKYICFEKLYFEIENHIMLAEDMTFRLTRNLIKYISPSSVNLVRVALREIIMNAIEHGNLGISFNDKSLALENGNYLEFLTQRQNEMAFSGKKVKISYTLTDKLVEYVIEDEGAGFDYKKVFEQMKEKNKNNFLMHGRGITIACSIFDKIIYNDRGNSVSLIKYYDNSIA
ncbi:MAG: ATP-binding protein [Spirochaetes bacterium]|nr:ATP-binding protein [Spirochaetota bacterium]